MNFTRATAFFKCPHKIRDQEYLLIKSLLYQKCLLCRWLFQLTWAKSSNGLFLSKFILCLSLFSASAQIFYSTNFQILAKNNSANDQSYTYIRCRENSKILKKTKTMIVEKIQKHFQIVQIQVQTHDPQGKEQGHNGGTEYCNRQENVGNTF